VSNKILLKPSNEDAEDRRVKQNLIQDLRQYLGKDLSIINFNKISFKEMDDVVSVLKLIPQNSLKILKKSNFMRRDEMLQVMQ